MAAERDAVEKLANEESTTQVSQAEDGPNASTGERDMLHLLHGL